MARGVSIPSIGTYRDVAIHAFQSAHRIDRVVKPAIDYVWELKDPPSLLAYAGDHTNPPEARLLAEHVYRAMFSLASDKHSGRADFDLQLMQAHTAGVDSLDWASTQYYCSLLCRWGPGQAGAAPRPPEYGEALEVAKAAAKLTERSQRRVINADF